MFRSILVPLDGTPFAEAALPIASRLAKACPGSLHLVFSHQLTTVVAGFAEMPVASIKVDEALRLEEHAYLRTIAAELEEAGIGTLEYREVDGPPGTAIVEEAVRIGADLVVMATHGRGLAGRLWHGSVADHVVRHLDIPVLLIHPDDPQMRLGAGKVRGILVALDLSTSSDAILKSAEDLARLTECPLTLLHMIQEPVPQPGHLRQSSVEAAIGTPSISPKQAAEQLEAIADGLRQRGLTVATRVTRGFNPAWVLRDAMTESQFDLLAMTTHGRGGWRRLWMGSVAEELVRTVAKPTLILRSVLARSNGLSGVLTP